MVKPFNATVFGIGVMLFSSSHFFAQGLPQSEAVVKTIEKITSVDGAITIGSVGKWFSAYKKADVGTIASPEAGWQNRARVFGIDCEAVFQVVPRSSLGDLSRLHPWLKFPVWVHVVANNVKIGKDNAVVITRKKISEYLSDSIYVANLDKDRVVIVRMVVLGPSNRENRSQAVREFVNYLLDGNIAVGQELAISKINIKQFIDKRDAPTSLKDASNRLVQLLTPAEKTHLLQNIHDEYELIEYWPIIEDRVSRLHWIMVYWGLNDPSSPLRKCIPASGNEDDNSAYILEVLKSTEKLLREKR